MPSDESPQSPVLIAGGGVGGLFAALCLAKKGIRCHVFERAPEFREVGYGLHNPANMSHVLEHLGLMNHIRARSYPVPRLELRCALSGDLIGGLDMDEVAPITGQRHTLIHRQTLLEILVQGCRDSPLVTLHADSTVIGWEDVENSPLRATVQHQDPASPPTEVVEGLCLIAADGLFSKLRSMFGVPCAPKYTGLIAHRSLLHKKDLPAEIWFENCILFGGPKFHLITYPVGRDSSEPESASVTFVHESDISNKETDRIAAIVEDVNVHPRVRELALEVMKNCTVTSAVHDMDPQPNIIKGRVALLGDAAFPMMQLFAQGAAQASEDAHVLANHFSTEDVEGSLLRYAEARFPRRRQVVEATRALKTVYHVEGPLAEVRKKVLPTYTNGEALRWLWGVSYSEEVHNN